jgi:hypothetical protein
MSSPASPSSTDADTAASLEALRLLAERPELSQRQLSQALGLTPKGLKEKIRLTRSFLARKEAEFELLRSTIAQLRQEVQREDSRVGLPPP